MFSETLYQARVDESAAGSGARDVYVTTVTATDGDVGENARLSYRVLDDPRSEFKVTDDGRVLAVRGERARRAVFRWLHFVTALLPPPPPQPAPVLPVSVAPLPPAHDYAARNNVLI